MAVQASGLKPRIAGHYLVAAPPIRRGFDNSDVYDISAPNPSFVGTLPTGVFLHAGPSRAVFAEGQIGMRVLDIGGSGPSLPISSLFDEVSVQQAASVYGDYVLSAEGAGGLAIYDVSAHGGLVRQRVFDSSSFLEGAALDQLITAQNLYVAAGTPTRGGLLVYDLQTQPAAFVSSFETGNSPAQALAIANNTLFLGTVDDVRILDVTIPGLPVQIGSVPVGTAALAVSGNLLFVGTVANQLRVYDISNPSSPVQVSSVALPDLPIQMRLNGSLLFVADSSAGLLIFDVATPSSPFLLSQTQPSTLVVGVALDGNLALLAAWEEGIVIADCANAALPIVTGRVRLDTITPFSALSSELLNRAAAITLQDKIAFLGVFNADPHDPPQQRERDDLWI